MVQGVALRSMKEPGTAYDDPNLGKATAARIGVPYEDFVAAAAKEIPVRRTGRPEDIAAAVSFFCSPDASFVSGQVLYVAGGPRA